MGGLIDVCLARRARVVWHQPSSVGKASGSSGARNMTCRSGPESSGNSVRRLAANTPLSMKCRFCRMKKAPLHPAARTAACSSGEPCTRLWHRAWYRLPTLSCRKLRRSRASQVGTRSESRPYTSRVAWVRWQISSGFHRARSSRLHMKPQDFSGASRVWMIRRYASRSAGVRRSSTTMASMSLSGPASPRR